MINYKETVLSNGLTVLVSRDKASRMAAVNVLYRVGARNEESSHTGFAHLFEHLMFRGTRAVPHFDVPVQEASGENNAFTNNDYTDYYITLPNENIETALWLESDRMTGLDISPEALETEKKVVIEEFNQRYLNQPYGDQWLLLRAMAYKVHPYRWPTIGLETGHIAKASLDRVRDFYKTFYTPSNAILSLVADLPEERMIELAEKYFGMLPSVVAGSGRADLGIASTADSGAAGGYVVLDALGAPLPAEPPQIEARRHEITRPELPAAQVSIAFHIGDRRSREFYVADMITDLLGGGTSARLHQRLVKERQIFSGVNAYVSGDIDPGLVVVTGFLHTGVAPSEGEAALWGELRALAKASGEGGATDYEMQKVKNKFEASTLFGELNVMGKAMNLGYYNMLGDMSLLNGEVAIQRSITAAEVAATANRIFTSENSSTLIYKV